MRLSVIVAVVAGAGIAQVAATPLRIIIASPHQEGVNPLDGARFGHSGPLAPAVATWKVTAAEDRVAGLAPGIQRLTPVMQMRRPCHGRMNRVRQKGIEISNAFRKALGLPLIETDLQRIHKGGQFHGGFVSIQPRPPFRTPQWEEIHRPKEILGVSHIPHPHNTPPSPPFPHHRHHRFHHHGPHSRNGPFIARLHHSLMHLGRWEGRAVAFVLGCGIGVLLRMFWVLAIVTYRAVKGQREAEHEYSHITIIEEYDETPVHTPPPTYIYPVDEKVALKEDEAPKTPVTTEESK